MSKLICALVGLGRIGSSLEKDPLREKPCTHPGIRGGGFFRGNALYPFGAAMALGTIGSVQYRLHEGLFSSPYTALR